MSKFTPGPWSFNKTISGRAITPAKGSAVAYVMGNNSAEGMRRERAGENDANARLIAAAPDLLAALEHAENFMSGFEDDDTQDDITVKLAGIRAAIYKAKGV